VSYNAAAAGYAVASERDGPDAIIGGPGADRFSLYFVPNRGMVPDHVLDFEAGDVVDLSSIMQFVPNQVEGSDPFDLGLLRLTERGSDMLLEANLSGADFKTILVLEDTSPELLSSENFDWIS